MAQKVTERETLAVNLTPEAREIVRGIREATNIPNTAAVAQILNWFASLPPKLRLAVLTNDGGTRDELLMDWFRESLNEKGLDVDVREGDDYAARARQVKKLVDQMHALYEGVRGVAVEARKGPKGAR